MTVGLTVEQHPAGSPDPTWAGEGVAGPPVARRVLVVSADIGGGHDATARALQERVGQVWPGSTVRSVDTLAVMGPGVGPALRGAYVANVQVTPWLYEFFYASLWRHRWFAAASKRFVGAWAGRRLAPVVAAFDPDLILSTYPLGSAGLAWLRQRRGLGVPIGAWVSDCAPHPYWVYPQLDLNLVVHPGAVPLAVAAAPGAAVAVCPPPVVSPFHPGDTEPARRGLGLDPARPMVLVASGSLGFGAVEEAVRALAGPGNPEQEKLLVVAVCGRNRRLAERLTALGLPADRLKVLGWVDTMPDLLRAADVVVTNAGGATALEAMATGTALVMYQPIAAHGAANAALMTACGLAETCRSPAALAASVRYLLHARRTGAAPHTALMGLPDLGLRAVADRTGPSPVTPAPGRHRRPAAWPLRPQDAFFLHVQLPTIPQQIGVVLDLDPTPSGHPLRRADLVDVLRRRLPAIVTLRRRLVSTGRWRRPGWMVVGDLDPEAHVDEWQRPAGADAAASAAVLDEFWSEPVALDAPPWRMLLLTGLPDGRTRLAIKMHHCLGDGLSAIGTLRRLLDPTPTPGHREPESVNPVRPASARRPPPPAAVRIRASLQHAALMVRGLGRLAAAGPAPRTTLNRRLATPRRRLVTISLPIAEVNRATRACGVHASELVCTLVAEALNATCPAPVPDRLRAMFAVSRGPRQRSGTHGNWTGAVALDLPMGPMPPPARAAVVRERLRRSLTSGQPAAAGLIMRAIGALPAPLHARLARRVYTSRFTNVIVSYMPGPATPYTLAGAPVRAAAPVVPLADGVPVGVGALRWADAVGIGVLLDASLADVGDRFVTALHTALDQVLR